MKKEIEEISKELSLPIREEQAAKLECFVNLILNKNEEINLISRKDTENIWTRHIGDSLAFYPLLKKLNLYREGLKIADIGAGGGFPSLPLAVILENYFFSLYESSLRKYEFLIWATMELKLSNVSVFRKRIEKKDRGEFDICLERAAGEPFEIIPLCKNLCRSGGNVVIWQYERNISKIEKTNPPYFIYNYSVGGEAEKVLLVFRRS